MFTFSPPCGETAINSLPLTRWGESEHSWGCRHLLRGTQPDLPAILFKGREKVGLVVRTPKGQAMQRGLPCPIR